MPEWQKNSLYAKAFQYEAEKLGFLNFLDEHNLSYDQIDHGPKFIDSVKAYQITCRNGNSYFLRFDYNKQKWELLEL